MLVVIKILHKHNQAKDVIVENLIVLKITVNVINLVIFVVLCVNAQSVII
jgi:hypothetical protein